MSGLIPLDALPTLNAALNGTAAVLLLTGFAFIKKRRVRPHKACMLSAFGVSLLFLASYLWYHAHHGSEPFRGTGFVRPIYFGILLSHTILAASVPILGSITLYRGLRSRFARHVRIARWTLPIWIYVSVTGVVVYAMLYHAYPRAEAAAAEIDRADK